MRITHDPIYDASSPALPPPRLPRCTAAATRGPRSPSLLRAPSFPRRRESNSICFILSFVMANVIGSRASRSPFLERAGAGPGPTALVSTHRTQQRTDLDRLIFKGLARVSFTAGPGAKENGRRWGIKPVDGLGGGKRARPPGLMPGENISCFCSLERWSLKLPCVALRLLPTGASWEISMPSIG